MPELPDISDYLEALRPRVVGEPLLGVRLQSMFVLRSVEPPLSAFQGRPVADLRRLGKRIVLAFDDELFLVIHLMVAGRLKWGKPGAKHPGRIGLAAFDFPQGTLLFTEASKKKRASLHAVRGEAGLAEHDRGGLEVLEADLPAFSEALRRENHTLKRMLTDPRVFSGIGNAYSDEILHRARLSPLRWTSRLDDEEVSRLFDATREILREWIARLRAETGSGFPEGVTAFRPEMAVHGKYQQPCPVCGSPVQRIRYAENETNYCPTCQNEGRLLADRALSQLLKKDWPKSLDEMDELKSRHRNMLES